MGIAAPWSDQVLDAPLDSYSAAVEAWLVVGGMTYPVTIDGGSVEIQGRRTPTVSANLTLAWPEDEVRRWLDPRLGGQIDIWAGYEFTDQTKDVQRLATLRIDEAEQDHGERTVTLRAYSDEVIVLGYPVTSTVSLTTSSEIVAAIQSLVAGAFPGETLAWSVDDRVRRHATFDAAVTITPGEDRWTYVQDWADILGATVWHDGLGTWHIDKAATMPTGLSAAVLRTGRRGVLSELTTTETRDGHCNAAMAIYEYTVGTTTYREVATAQPANPITPVIWATATRNFKPTNAAAVAANMLARGIRRGHSFEAGGAVFWWLRPDRTVSIQTPDGVFEEYLADFVSFDLAEGTMRVTGQAADPMTIQQITTTSNVSTL